MRKVLFMLLLCSAVSAEAATRSSTYGPDWVPQKLTEQDHGLLRYDAMNYLYSPDSGREMIFQSLSVRKIIAAEGSAGKFSSNLEAIVTLTPSAQPYFEAQELYYQTPTTPRGFDLSVGRKMENWSTLDQSWKLGIWQPRFRWDYLHPETVGLTGVFATLNLPDVGPGIRIVAMASPLFVPERGVPIAVSEGQFSSPSPWFIAPSSKIVLFDRDTPIHYDLRVPPTMDIVQQTSFGLMARLGKETTGPWTQAAWTAKPMNQLLMGYEGALQLTPPINAEVAIQPRVGYHQLFSWEAGHTTSRLNTSLSALYEKPAEEQAPPLWTYQTPKPAWLLSPSIAWNLTDSARAPQIHFSYLRTWGGNGADQGYDNRDSSVFEGRFPFQNTLRTGIRGPLRFLNKQFAGSARFTYDLEENGSIWSCDLHYLPKETWSVKLGTDLLATDVLGSNHATGPRFISRYQVNNRIHAGLSYVF